MDNTLDETLFDVAEEVFEDLAFVLAMPDDGSVEHDDCPDAHMLVAGIEFKGPFGGTLFLKVARELLPMLAANMLGLEDDRTPSPEEQDDAFRELLNVICGNLLPKIAGNEVVFDVGGAKCLEDNRMPEDFEGQKPVGSARFDLEVGNAELALFSDTESFNDTGQYDASLKTCAATEEQ